MTIGAFRGLFCGERISPRMKFVVFAAMLVVAGVAVLPLRADVTVRCVPQGTNQTVCRVDQPIVTERSKDYPEVVFHAGDTVMVDAGGCVQTGGSGATWKRYVDPQGPNSNKYYWGTISIPGATPGLIRLSDAIGKPWTVPTGVAGELVLKLGYVDDIYHDNGYWGHDDGTGNQCKGVGNAWVQLTITHSPGTTASCAGSTGNSDLDLTWTNCDVNGLPLNPKFQWQAKNTGPLPSPLKHCPSAKQIILTGSVVETVIKFPESCIEWPVTYDSGFWCGPHVNYLAVTYQSSDVHWWEKSSSLKDDDYNFFMYMPNQEGVDGGDGMEIEFDSDETVDHFSSPLWMQFKGRVNNDNAALEKFVDNRSATVTLLFGLDCGHESCGSEQHPAYAMAFDYDNTNLQDDQWLVFARNWGDEGFCADDEHDLPMSDLKLIIPWLPGATGVVVGPDTQFNPFADSDSGAAVPQPQVTVVNGQGILLEFSLPSPGTHLGMEGEVHLQWTVSEAARAMLIAKTRQQPQAVQLHPADEADLPETRIGNLFLKLAPAQLQAAEARVSAAGVKRRVATPTTVPIRPVVKVANALPPRSLKLIKPVAVPDARIQQKHEAMRQALCEAYKNNVPGYPALCRATAPSVH